MESGTFGTRFIEFEDVATGTASFRFERPDGYEFQAGQFFMLTLETRDGRETKPFTHSSSPADPALELTTRLTGSAFKDALLALRPGDPVEVAGPRGRMTLRPGDAKVAFLVGGVGVTPARSIVRDAVQRGTGVAFALFYGNQNEPGIPFASEFAAYAATHPEIVVIHVLAEPGPGWEGETGFITADVVRKHVDPYDGWHWVVAGPPAMITAMEKVIDDLGVARDTVSFERFSGYAPA